MCPKDRQRQKEEGVQKIKLKKFIVCVKAAIHSTITSGISFVSVFKSFAYINRSELLKTDTASIILLHFDHQKEMNFILLCLKKVEIVLPIWPTLKNSKTTFTVPLECH